MKKYIKLTILAVFLFCILTSCSPDVYIDIAGATAARPIPDNTSLEKLFKYINPNTDYDYWALTKREFGYPKRFTNVLQVGDKLQKNSIEYRDSEYADYYIAAVINNTPYYYDVNEDIVSFLGEIDTLQEALIVAYCYNYEVDVAMGANTYQLIDGNYVMHLLNKNHDLFNYKEIAEVTITKEGFIKTRVIKSFK